DTGILHETSLPGRIEPRDLVRVEARERKPIAIPFSQNGVPTEARLRALQDQHLEQMPIIARRHSPFSVVVVGLQLVAGRPPAPDLRAVPVRCGPTAWHDSIPPRT